MSENQYRRRRGGVRCTHMHTYIKADSSRFRRDREYVTYDDTRKLYNIIEILLIEFGIVLAYDRIKCY